MPAKKLRVIQPTSAPKRPKSLRVVDAPTQFATLGAANGLCGGLSQPSKMPGYGYSIPAQACVTGSKLAQVEGSVCHGCYALDRGNYRFQNVKDSLQKRLESLTHPDWVDAMVYMIAKRVDPKVPYFRWHDSGDLQSVDHLRRICDVARRTPDVSHWLPTREYGMVRLFLTQGGAVPSNLTIRVSAHMIDGAPADKLGLPHSSVSTDDAIYPNAFQCPARHQGNACQDCRACWDGSVQHVAYYKH